MPSPFIQRQIDELLEEAARAIKASNWDVVVNSAHNALALDPENEDAQSLLAAAERAQPARAEGPPPREQRDAGISQGTAARESLLPETFASGRYTVKKFLGEGGKKKVYLAHDTLLDRDVAFALIKTEGLDDIGRDRITREAQAMGRLGAHPHIVSVFDLGGEDGQPYIVTELMGGGDVEGLIEKASDHRPPLERTLEIGVQVSRGLEFAHDKGIVHRDIKPGNVWLTADGVAKIGDFGLAVAIDRTRLTQAGMMVGTVSYMPPEQAAGGEVTPQSDLYSLGAMLYEMVTGRPPFVGDDAVAIIGQHLNTQPVSPSWHRPDCPPGLEVLVLRLLEKDPGKRPSTAAEVQTAIQGEQAALKTAPKEERSGGGARENSPAAPPEPAVNPLYRRAFVGRDNELRQLQAAFDGALSGKGALAMVVGEPGIGKTSVCEHLSTYAALRGGKALIGHCYEEGSLSLPYLPFVEAMRSYILARDREGLKSDLGSGAVEVARIVSEIRDRVQVTPSDVGDAEEQRWRLLQAVSGFLRNASTVQPLLVILEDLHDADRGTLDLLVHLSRNLDGARLLIIGTYRDVEVDRSHPLSSALAELRRGQNFLRVPLRGLTAEEVQRMMASVSQREIPWPFAELVHRQTEGNPLFVQEMLRYLVEEGLVSEQGGSLRRVGDASLAGRIPEGLRDVIGKRLSRLSEQTNQALAVAAVMGREFRLDVLQRVAGLPEEALYAALAEAKAVAVVEERSAVGAAVSYRFTHAFFRQTLYEETIAPRRIRLHQQVARTLEVVYGRRLDEHAAELAEHYAYSADPADLAKAVGYGELAARRALSVYAYGEAERHLIQALKVQEVLDPDDKAKRCDLLLAVGGAMLPGEEPQRVISFAAEEAFALGEALGDHTRMARAAVMALEALARHSTAAPQHLKDVSRLWCDRADRAAPQGTVLRVYADAYVGTAWIATVSRERGHEYLRRAASAAQQLDDNSAFYLAAGFTLLRLQALRDHQMLYDLAREALRRGRYGVRSADLALCLRASADVLLEHGDRAAAVGAWEELEGLAERTRDIAVSVWAHETRLYKAFLDGHLEVVVEVANATKAEREARGLEPLGPWLLSRALLYLGAPADPLLEERPLAARPQLAARARLLAQLGRSEEAQAIRASFTGIEQDEDESGLTVLVSLLETSVLIGDRGTAEPLTRRLKPLALLPWSPTAYTSYGRLLGGAAVLLGDSKGARSYYEQAQMGCEQINFRPELALIRLELAELLLARYPDERAAAIDHLDFAIAEFREMKMQPSLERALRRKEVLRA